MSNELMQGVALYKELLCVYHNVKESELDMGSGDMETLFQIKEDLSQPINCDIHKCKEILRKLKLVLIHLPSLDPLVPIGKKNTNELLLARHILEKGVIISIMDRDIKSFSIYMAQLLLYYTDYQNFLPKSQRQNGIIGMYLLYLLSSNLIGDFHMTLEIISIEDQNDEYIKYVLELEQHIMDGYFYQVLTKKDDIPLHLYGLFIERLYNTIRYKLAECIFASSNCISSGYACELLKFVSEEDLYQFIGEYNETKTSQGECNLLWEVRDNKIYFNNQTVHVQDLPALEVLNNTIGYATELERIV
ncbi:26S proteasome regulatory subunit RPN12, putative [Plasmodium knowlesi strain H]|uniref:26S proteasome regulatory subunit RPN12, putative n=3 Tax=Plasmodium knowlesi TaxID=5850 RepID=A0A5K1UDM8_PLAKH|nr:26S proteasome regulatory subunit RPN12, putative [Plasmodium knowlesi strain H]OTN66096.1 putative 26S proteasome non-ATPase regulatory subunit [Plasmodium knowlesi]CAA9987942.1 26S proteasome regulatory subunit RPN12, putative [Plasmodium knowlesi strain H]SBO22194.1 26S proteasome regulatory subunit RPN12, putative [Plasmodium knowlesi strain H]SBO29199.1 26S proteasome regulatory subunit RPN12, putative [Plasmodium knowlesi strain H]VVS77416.1 26S proteasome regulatory subunit RPN12, pu|eukprot:XP_002258922.1 26S proteasome non-ATPase regulatory subunit,putative [Plasmodium knowlesi strain H]